MVSSALDLWVGDAEWGIVGVLRRSTHPACGTPPRRGFSRDYVSAVGICDGWVLVSLRCRARRNRGKVTLMATRAESRR